MYRVVSVEMNLIQNFMTTLKLKCTLTIYIYREREREGLTLRL